MSADQPFVSASSAYGNLAALNFRTEYRSLKDDPVEDFYQRCLSNAINHKRAVGYFKSSVFLVIGASVLNFARRGGRMAVICSPQLDLDDIDSIALGYARRSERITDALISQFDELLSDPRTAKPAQILATLIALNILELKLAIRADRKGLYHEKIGIFRDEQDNCVSFKGSANETWSAWDHQGNFESIEVFCSWRGGLEAERVKRHEAHFDALWSEHDPDVEVFPFPARAIEHLKHFAMRGLDQSVQENPLALHKARVALPHQEAALKAWRSQGCRGIFEHATGSGKTFTAILAIRNHVLSGLPAIVLVPSKLLLEQWAIELRGEIPNATLLLAGAGNDRWKSANRLQGMTDSERALGPRIVLATMQTASTPTFLNSVRGGDHLLVIADEVHQIGSEHHSRLLDLHTGARLGLSATPKRFGDPDGTSRIFSYFGPIVPPPITLADAISAGRLVPYEYYPHAINLTQTEADQWKELTAAIKLEIARNRTDDQAGGPITEKAKMLLIRRSRIAKKATAKVQLAVDVLSKHFEVGQS